MMHSTRANTAHRAKQFITTVAIAFLIVAPSVPVIAGDVTNPREKDTTGVSPVTNPREKDTTGIVIVAA